MTTDIVITVLASSLVVLCAFFMWQIQKLLDKLMSRSYTEYTRAQEPIVKPPVLRLEEDEQEDLGPLSEFQR